MSTFICQNPPIPMEINSHPTILSRKIRQALDPGDIGLSISLEPFTIFLSEKMKIEDQISECQKIVGIRLGEWMRGL